MHLTGSRRKETRRLKMKNTPYFEHHKSRYHSEARVWGRARFYQLVEAGYQSSNLVGGCGTPAKFHKPAFFDLSNRYVADEEPRGIAIDTAVFGALIGST